MDEERIAGAVITGSLPVMKEKQLIGRKIVGMIARRASTSVVGVIFDDGSAATFTSCGRRERS